MEIQGVLRLNQDKVFLTDFVIDEFLEGDWIHSIPVKKGHHITHENVTYEIIDHLSVSHLVDDTHVNKLALVVKHVKDELD